MRREKEATGRPVMAAAPSAAIRHIRQRNGRDCGIAAAAMLAGVSYREAAAAADPAVRPGDGLRAMGVARMLRRLTGRLVRISDAGDGCALAAYEPTADPAVILIHEPGDTRGHFVVVSGGLVYDPERDAPSALESYVHRRWHIADIVTVEAEAA